MTTINELNARLRRIEQLFEYIIVGQGNPLPGATPEVMAVDLDGASLSEMVRVHGLPGQYTVAPPTSQLLILRTLDGQDPVAIAGVGTPASIKAALIQIEKIKATGGGHVIVDPLAGTGGLVVTPTGVDVLGALTNNGVPLP